MKAPLPHEFVPEQLGRFRIEGEVARGGMAVVLRALDPATGQRVALKQLSPEAARKPSIVRLFEREYQTLAQLRHPSIIEVYEYGVGATGCYYTMELLDGSDLRELSPLPFREVCRYLRDIASSLALLHTRGLAHRDVSPRNIRIGADGHAKLIDFGAVVDFGISSDVVGTPPCIPPESLRSTPLDARSDLYALGAAAYFALTGRHAYPARTLSELEEIFWKIEPSPPSSLVDGIPPALDDLVLSLLQHDPLARPSSASEVVERLALIADLPPEESVRVTSSYLRSAPVVGREHQIGTLRDALVRADRASGSSVLVRGASGVGKSRILEAFAVAAELKGATVLRCDAGQSAEDFAVARQMLRALAATAPSLAREAIDPVAKDLAMAFPEIGTMLRLDPSDGKLPVHSGDRRVRIQLALDHVVRTAARDRTLVITIDRLEHADDESLAFLTALAHEGTSTRLLSVGALAAGTRPRAPGAVRRLRKVSASLFLAPLSPEQTTELVSALFSGAENCARLAAWLHRASGGLPNAIVELARDLVERGLIQYLDGSFVVPYELPTRSLPASLDTVYAERLARLSEPSRRALRALSVFQRSIPGLVCERYLRESSASERPADALSELVHARLLLRTELAYQLQSEAIRDQLVEELGASERTVLHRHAAKVLLAGVGSEFSELEAGWHLVSAGDTAEGAEILARAGVGLCRRGIVSREVADALEKALTIFEARERPDHELKDLLLGLTMAGLFVEPVYAERYGDRTLRVLLERVGVAAARTLRPWLGSRLALAAGLVAGTLKERVRSAPESPATLFRDLILCTTSIGAVAAICSAHDRLERLVDALTPLDGFGEDHPAAFTRRLPLRLLCHSQGRYSLAVELTHGDLERIEDPSFLPDLSALERRQLESHLLIILSLTYAYLGDRRVFESTERLARSDAGLFQLYAHQARFLFHVARGEFAAAKEYRERVELLAIQGGTTWQVELFVQLIMGNAYILAEDAVGFKRAYERLQIIARRIPTVRDYAVLMKAHYLTTRGKSDRAIELFRAILEPEERISPDKYYPAVIGIARCANRLGRHDEALAICRRADARADAETYENRNMRTAVAIETAFALSSTKDRGGAVVLLDACLARASEDPNRLQRGCLHEARARVALMGGDRIGCAEHLRRFREDARDLQLPTLVSRAEALARELDPPAPATRGFTDDTGITSQLETMLGSPGIERSPESMARCTLELLTKPCCTSRGHLFAIRDAGVVLLASVGSGAPPPWLEERVEAGVRPFIESAETAASEPTETLTTPDTESESDVDYGGYHISLLRFIADDEMRLVGAIALEVGEEFTPPSPSLVASIARQLAQSGIVRAVPIT